MFSLASLGTIIACVFLLGTFLSVALNVRSTMQQMEQSVGISVFFDEGISEERKNQIGEEIQKKEDIATMRYVSAEEAWEIYKKDVFQGNEELLEGFEGNNPLKESDSYEITLKEVESYKMVVSHLEKIDGVRKVRYSQGSSRRNDKDEYDGELYCRSSDRDTDGGFYFPCEQYSFCRSSSKRRRDSDHETIGAANGFIKAPFRAEGMIIGCDGFIDSDSCDLCRL